METKDKKQNAEQGSLATQAQKLKKQRRRQLVASAIGVAVLIWGAIKIIGIFIDYKSTETSNGAQVEQYLAHVNLPDTEYIRQS